MTETKPDVYVGVLTSVHGINRALKRRASARHGESLGLLTVLSAVATAGQVRASALAEQLCTDLSGVSRKLSALETKGLIEKVADEHDRRAQLVGLTAVGAELLGSLRASSAQWLAAALDGWSGTDLAALARLLTKLETDLSIAADANPTPARTNGLSSIT